MLALQCGLKMGSGDPGLQKVSLGQGPWCLGSPSGRQERYPALPKLAISPVYSHLPM